MIPNDAHARDRLLIFAADTDFGDACSAIAEKLDMVLFSMRYAESIVETSLKLRPTCLILDLNIAGNRKLAQLSGLLKEGLHPEIVLLAGEDMMESLEISRPLSALGLNVIDLILQPVTRKKIEAIMAAIHKGKS